MITIENEELAVDIIDPVAERNLLGSRYCTGGYIFQVRDRRRGELFCGPNFPDGEFNPFDGQGAPEVFLMALGEECAQVGSDVFVPGVGMVRRTSAIHPFHSRDNPHVSKFSDWEIDRRIATVEMRTRHDADTGDIEIARTVLLSARTVVSKTELWNAGNSPITFRWFPHPFFPIPADRIACSFGFPFSIPQNAGYVLTSSGCVELSSGYDWARGLYLPLLLEHPVLFEARQFHPLVHSVSMRCDYLSAFVPLWANHRTLSFEPYLEKQAGACERLSWRVEYSFGRYR